MHVRTGCASEHKLKPAEKAHRNIMNQEKRVYFIEIYRIKKNHTHNTHILSNFRMCLDTNERKTHRIYLLFSFRFVFLV